MKASARSTAVLLLAGCACPAEQVPSVTAEVSEVVGTVITVGWTSEQPTTGYVEFGETTDYRRRSPSTAEGTDHEVLLLGMPSLTDVHFRVVMDDGTTSDDQVITTTVQSPRLPGFAVTGDTGSWQGFEVMPSAGSSQAVTIIDGEGNIVWWWVADQDFAPVRALPSHDGTGMLIMQGAGTNAAVRADTHILRVSWDGSQVDEIPMPDLDHDFLELPDGTLVGLLVAEKEGYTALGDRIVEVSADGTWTEVWNSWNAFDPETQGSEHLDEEHWTHANSLDYDPVADAYIVGLRNFSSVLAVDRATGEILWALGGEANEFTYTEGSEPTQEQHQFDLVHPEDGLLASPLDIVIFDNGDAGRGWSRVVQYSLDLDAHTAEQTWQYVRDPAFWTYIKGDVHRFSDGTTQVVWATSGEIQDVTAEGEVLWQLDTAIGNAVLYTERVADLYPQESTDAD